MNVVLDLCLLQIKMNECGARFKFAANLNAFKVRNLYEIVKKVLLFVVFLTTTHILNATFVNFVIHVEMFL